jgi:Glycosyltransferase family 10 (fucosyltransferase) C-term
MRNHFKGSPLCFLVAASVVAAAWPRTENALSLANNGNLTGALHIFLVQATNQPTSSNWNNVGVTQMRIRDYSGARKSFQIAHSKDPSDRTALANIAEVEKLNPRSILLCLYFGDFRRAHNLAITQLRKYPYSSELWLRMAVLYLRFHMYHLARASFSAHLLASTHVSSEERAHRRLSSADRAAALFETGSFHGALSFLGGTAASGNTLCPPLPAVNGTHRGAYFICYPSDTACGGFARNLARRLSTPDYLMLFEPACFGANVHPRVYFSGGHGTIFDPLYSTSDIRIIYNPEADGLPAAAGSLYDLGITGITSVPQADLTALRDFAGVQVYMPFLAFGVIHHEGQSELDLLLSPLIGSYRPYFAAYATRYCHVVVRNQAYTLLEKYRFVHGLNMNCHNGQEPPEGRLRDRSDETSYMTTLVERLKLYKFAIVFENQIAPGYLTEKLANARKAGAVPVYWGTSFAREVINPDAFVDCSPFGEETQEEALERCVSEVVELDQNDTAWREMAQQPFMRDGKPIDYTPLGGVVRGILDCKRRGCSELSESTVCRNIQASPFMRQAYFVPRRFGSCNSSFSRTLASSPVLRLDY